MIKSYEYNKIGENLFICLLTTKCAFKVCLKEDSKEYHTVNQISFLIVMGEISDIDVLIPSLDRLYDMERFDLFDIDEKALQANIIKVGKQILLEDKLTK